MRKRARIDVQTYEWSADAPKREAGVRLHRGNGFVFLRWDEITEATNQLIDALEAHESENSK